YFLACACYGSGYPFQGILFRASFPVVENLRKLPKRYKSLMNAPTGTAKYLLRLEGLAVLIGAALAYAHLDFSWWHFALFFLLPDVSFFGYLAGPKVGAVGYNLAHTYLFPVLLLALTFLLPSGVLTKVALIWLAHIGFDRLLGYGLKYASGFNH